MLTMRGIMRAIFQGFYRRKSDMGSTGVECIIVEIFYLTLMLLNRLYNNLFHQR